MSDISDIVSAFIFCPTDGTVLLIVEPTNDYGIPCIRVSSEDSWEKKITKEVEQIFSLFLDITRVLRLYKVWSPEARIYHCVFLMNCDGELKKRCKPPIGRYKGKTRWSSESDIVKFYQNHNLRLPEIFELYFMAKAAPFSFIPSPEIINRGNFCEINDEALVTVKSTNYDAMVLASELNRQAQETLYREFLNLSFPAIYMCLTIFFKCVFILGWGKEDTPFLFRCADINDRNSLTFREFMYILIAVDPNTRHSGSVSEIRGFYIFRFFDRDRDQLLNPVEFKGYILASRKARKMSFNLEDVTKEAEICYKNLNIDSKYSLSLPQFLKGIAEGKIQGAGQVLRSVKNLQQLLKDITEKNSKVQKKAETSSTLVIAPLEGKRRNMTYNTPAALSNAKYNYDIACHSVKIEKFGQAINIEELFSIQEGCSQTTLKQPTNEQVRRVSIDIFSQKSISNELLRGVRYLVQANKKSKGAPGGFTWGQLDSNTFHRNLMSVCLQVQNIFRCEPRLIDLNSPVYVLGDFHGNVNDLLYFERVFWHIGPCLCPCGLLFLGDYVDRGPYSIEVISYLFAYKIQSPKKVTMLRGNHEIREVQKMFTFYGECILKFGNKLGMEIWTAINNVFDSMPIAATIDKKIFCCHGGIPPPWLCPVISAINDIPVPLSQPDTQSSLAWEIMWNDPIRPKTVDEGLAMELLANEGFAVNTRRGTAHVWNVEALDRFLRANQFTHIIRAHEVAAAGFHVQQKGKLLTVFSSSKYCGGTNDAACVLVDQGRIRILRIETD